MPFLLLLLLFKMIGPGETSLLISRNVDITLFSEAPLENIEARSVSGISVLNPATGELQFTVPIRSFEFRKKLMQEHFNENYMESDKYPNARFKGKLIEKIDLNADGDYPVTATGDLEVHGVKRVRSIKGLISIRNKQVEVSSTFDVKCEDHKIKIPQIVFQKVAETIRVKVKGSYKLQNP